MPYVIDIGFHASSLRTLNEISCFKLHASSFNHSMRFEQSKMYGLWRKCCFFQILYRFFFQHLLAIITVLFCLTEMFIEAWTWLYWKAKQCHIRLVFRWENIGSFQVWRLKRANGNSFLWVKLNWWCYIYEEKSP